MSRGFLVFARIAFLLTLFAGTVQHVCAGDATLYRDNWGVPHIWADDFASAGYASGRAQCEDTAHNVIYCLHAGVGRLSEAFGPQYLKSDIEARKLGNAHYAEKSWPTLSPSLRELVEGYCAGVNDYLNEHSDDISVKIDPVTPIQVLAWNRSLMLRSAIGIVKADAEAAKSSGYHPDYPGRSQDEVGDDDHPGIEPGKSNSWALSGSKTASGSPMLLIDPHWVTDGNLQLYEQWMHVGDDFHVGGFTLTGSPLPGMGVTPHAAWTVTAGGADSADAYALEINPENAHQYRYDGAWKDMIVRQETIRIRQNDGSIEEQPLEVLETHHGPVLKSEGGVPYAAAFGGFRYADVLEQFFRMAAAKSTAQFKAALAMNRLSYFNLMWATHQGDIGFVQTGAAPVRPEGFNWDKMLPGWTSDTAYLGELPFEYHPTVENPAAGFLQNCNTAANVVAPGIEFTRDDFPPNVLWGHYGQYRARGARATQLLSEVDDATMEDGERIAFDTYAPPADLWVPVILEGVDEWEADDAEPDDANRLEQAADILRSWDRYATRDSVGATVFRFWRLACLEMESKAGRDSFDIPNTPEIRSDAVKALQQAVNQLIEFYGQIEVPWGDVKRLRRGDLDLPLSGDGLERRGLDTLRATAADGFDEDHKLIMRRGQCVTSVVELTDPPTIRSVVAYGQSNVPGSQHFADQAILYADEMLRSVPWTLEALEPRIESQVVLHYSNAQDATASATTAEKPAADELKIETSTHVYRNIEGHDIHLDVYRLPGDELRPAVMWIHGGALIVGDRNLLSTPPLKEQVTRLLKAGMTVVSIDYRLAPEAKLPEIIGDVQAAWTWLHDHSRELKIDSSRMAVAGQSAGGYLTLTSGFRLDPKPAALVSYYAYGDLTTDWLAKPSEDHVQNGNRIEEQQARAGVGTKPISSGGGNRNLFYLWCRQNGRWVQEVSGLDPVSDREKLTPFCAAHNVTPEYPPTMLLHGTIDMDVPHTQSLQMAEQLKKHGVVHELVLQENGNHGFDYALLENEEASAAVDRAVQFLKEHLK